MRSVKGSAAVVWALAIVMAGSHPAAGQAISPAARIPEISTGSGYSRLVAAGAEGAYLDPLNHVRRRLGLSPLIWSAPAAQEAGALAAQAASRGCTAAAAEAVVEGRNSAVFWAPALRRVDGQAQAQVISPGYAVSMWSDGRQDLDLKTRSCRDSSNCEAFLQMTAPTARSVGCSRLVCPSKAQILVCRFGPLGGVRTTGAYPVIQGSGRS